MNSMMGNSGMRIYFVVDHKYIRWLRKRLGYTQVTLARRCNVRVGTISDIETGKVVPRVDTLAAIAYVLDVDVDNLILLKTA